MITTAIKKALRIGHSGLDSELIALEQAARREMIRAGVDETLANSETDPLVTQAVKTYCKAEFYADTANGERFAESFKYQLDNLRKSSNYEPPVEEEPDDE